MSRLFTSENARENQLKGAAKRKENKARHELASAIARRILHNFHKLKDGSEVQGTELMLTKAYKRAIEDGDLASMQLLIKLAGEDTPQQVDITTNGETVNPFAGLSLAQIDKRLTAARKSQHTTQRHGKKRGSTTD